MLTVDEVLSAEKEWTQAHLETDIETLDRLMHPDYTIIKPEGIVWDKEIALASYIPGKRHWEKAGSSEYIVRIYGDMAIVIGKWEARGINNGEPFDYSARYTSIWIKENGKLMMVSDQSTEINY
jgi:ketosteroid isomerase-like protein